MSECVAQGKTPATETRAKPTRQTWRDWAPDAPEPPELWTRDDLAARLQAEDIAARPQDLLFWQRKGVVPYPVKKRQCNATTAYYAPCVAGLVRELRRLQGQGYSLEEIRPRLRVFARDLSRRQDASSTGSTPNVSLSAPSGALHTSHVHDVVAIGAEERASVSTTVAPVGFGPIATALARIYEEAYGARIRAVETRLVDERDNPSVFSFPTPPRDYTVITLLPVYSVLELSADRTKRPCRRDHQGSCHDRPRGPVRDHRRGPAASRRAPGDAPQPHPARGGHPLQQPTGSAKPPRSDWRS